jgi:exoribonuclease R
MEFHDVIAQWMIIANCAVAKKIYDSFPTSALLRHHSFPRADRFDTLLNCAREVGVTLSVASNRELSASLDAALDVLLAQGRSVTDSEWIVRILRALATRAMAEAQYFSTGSTEVADFYHYGLAAPFYTHFT